MEIDDSESFDTHEISMSLERAARLIAGAKRLVVFSGAGISAESGISTFRAPNVGVWANKIGLAYFGTPFGWWLTPGLAWKTYVKMFRDPIVQAEPNAGHISLVALEESFVSMGKRYDTITQNVDGLHQRAGNNPDRVYELHGTVWRHKCSKRGHVQEYIIDPSTIRSGEYDPCNDDYFSHSSYPRCDHQDCSSYLRPDATLFTEGLPSDAFESAARAVRKLRTGDLMIIIGTSGVVYPAASLAEQAISAHGVHTIEINPERSPYTAHVTEFLQGPSGAIIPALVELAVNMMEDGG